MAFTFGYRRIQQYGATFLISLPTVWVENQGLEKKDKLAFFLAADGSLILKKVLEDELTDEN